jgi:hypothetical protein
MVRSASQRPLLSLQPGWHPQTWHRADLAAALWQRQASAVPEHPIQVLLLRTNDLRFEAKQRQIERIIRADGISAIEARRGVVPSLPRLTGKSIPFQMAASEQAGQIA